MLEQQHLDWQFGPDFYIVCSYLPSLSDLITWIIKILFFLPELEVSALLSS